MNRYICRDDYAARHKHVLLRDHAYRNGTVGLLRRAEITLDELAFKMKRGRVDGIATEELNKRGSDFVDPYGEQNNRHDDTDQNRFKQYFFGRHLARE